MSIDVAQERQQAHAYLDKLAPAQISAVRKLLETMVTNPVSSSLANAPVEDEDIGEEEERTVDRSKEWFKHHPGTPFEDVVLELGFTLEQIRNREPA